MAKAGNGRKKNRAAEILSQLSVAELEREILTPQEVADFWGVTRNTVIRWIRTGLLPHFTKSTSQAAFYFVLKSDAEAFEPPPIGNPLLIGRRM